MRYTFSETGRGSKLRTLPGICRFFFPSILQNRCLRRVMFNGAAAPNPAGFFRHIPPQLYGLTSQYANWKSLDKYQLITKNNSFIEILLDSDWRNNL